MKYLKEFNTHASYEDKINIGGSDLEIPIVSYCDDVSDVHYNPYNTVEFYVGNITGTTPQTVKIYTGANTSIPIQVSEGNKWYSYVLQKDKGLCKIEGDSVKKVVVKANISFQQTGNHPGDIINFIPSSIVEASFKGSNTNNVTNISFMFYGMESLISLDLSNFNTSNIIDMNNMFNGCSGLTSLDVSNFDTSNVTNMNSMFNNCSNIAELDLSGWDTSKVTNMNSMFNNCSNIAELDLSGWNTSKVTNMDYMFNGCGKLSTITMKGCNQTTINKISDVKPSSATIIP